MCLEKDVFDECFNRLLPYIAYNEPHRHFIHGDCHPWNILSDGIIDGNCKYGDALIDIVTLDRYMKEFQVIDRYRAYLEANEVLIPHFDERIIGAKLYMGLESMRFYSKMGWNDAYAELRDEMLSLPVYRQVSI
ncbi:phosphotransferase [Paenibacillus aquistagni]|uniref:phosphotransferase n=1 Tax=Paenibacillus aquistagni TaxID=1852522 RepID=UPI001130298D